MKRGLLCTVGTGKDTEVGIALSLQQTRADRVVFVVSAQSAQKLKLVAEHMPAGELPPHDTLVVDDHEDLELCRPRCLAGLALLRQELGPESELYVDYTWGTKAMAAAAAIAALECKVGQLVYMGGVQRDATGRIVPGSERLHLMRPDRVLFDWELHHAKMLFNCCRYSAAVESLQAAAEGLGDPDVCATTRRFVTLAQACEAWERFDLPAAADKMNELDRGDLEALPEGTEELKGWLCQLGEQARRRPELPVAEQFPLTILADLVENARRRLADGDWLAASSRCYRCTEYLAQHLLAAKHEILTAAPEQSKLPDSFRAEYQGGPIALQQAYRLLGELSEEYSRLADAVLRSGKMVDSLRMRNDSIEAHGLAPVTEERARAFFEGVEELIAAAGIDLGKLRARCVAPKFEDA